MPIQSFWQRWKHRLTSWQATIALLIVTAVSVVVSYGLLSFSDEHMAMESPSGYVLIAANTILLMLVLRLVLWRLYAIWREVREGRSGSRLQKRLILIFSLLVLLPGGVVASFSGYLFYVGVHRWFDSKLHTVLEQSVAVAEAYLEEHKQNLQSDARGLASDIARNSTILFTNEGLFRQFLSAQVRVRSLSEAVVFRGDTIFAESELALTFAFQHIPQRLLERVAEGQVVYLNEEDNDAVTAIARIEGTGGAMLMVSRFVDPKILEHTERAKGAASEYQKLQSQINAIQYRFFLSFALLTVLLLLVAWASALLLASRLVRPIGKLATATEQVGRGDYSVRVQESKRQDEIAALETAFNRMTEQLEQQKRIVTRTNEQLDARRRFMEAVLEGVSAGVIALNAKRQVTLLNRSACDLLGCEEAEYLARDLGDVWPAIQSLLEQAERQPGKAVQTDIPHQMPESSVTLHVRVLAEASPYAAGVDGYVVTFDDITHVVTSQRSAAWADVARRIAHEIKNPLTPIQLAAQRLRRKYADKQENPEERENFYRYTDTITRHVETIGRMVEEFASFARMPAPSLRPVNLVKLVKEAVFSEECRWNSVHFEQELPTGTAMVEGDREQLMQVLTNLLKNAAEAIVGEGDEPQTGKVVVALEQQGQQWCLTVQDNGPGIPPELLEKLTEPYVTTKARGTGLGLAIVHKILVDHRGSLQFRNRTEGGAQALVRLPVMEEEKKASQATDS